jgi:hypothetical protein
MALRSALYFPKIIMIINVAKLYYYAVRKFYYYAVPKLGLREKNVPRAPLT